MSLIDRIEPINSRYNYHTKKKPKLFMEKVVRVELRLQITDEKMFDSKVEELNELINLAIHEPIKKKELNTYLTNTTAFRKAFGCYVWSSHKIDFTFGEPRKFIDHTGLVRFSHR